MRLPILAFAGGVALLQVQDELPQAAGLATCAFAALAGFLLAGKSRGRMTPVWLVLGCLLLGFSWAAWQAHRRLSEVLPEEWETRDVRITGIVAALPQRFERGERFLFDVESVQTAGATVPNRILLAWYHPWDELADTDPEATEETGAARALRPGERWRFTVRLKRPHGNANPHGFDYEAWLLERGVRATGSVRARHEMTRLADFVWRPGYIVERLRDLLRERFLTELPQAPYAGVLTALAIGDQRGIPAAQWQVFNRTGITHLVSISGLHVTMIAALCAAWASFLWRRSERLMLFLPAQKAAVAAGWLAAFGYSLLAGFEVPAQRTLYMLSVVAVSLWSGRNLGASRNLALALLTVLLIDPMAIMSTGFWLSFGAVAVLFFVGTARLDERCNGQENRWRAGLRQWGTTQWAVTLGSLPLLLLFFQQFSLVSPLANAVAIPVVSFVITPLALIFSALPWPPLLHFDHWIMAQLMLLLEWLADWPVWQQPAPPLWAILAAVLGVAWMLLPRGFPTRWIGACLLVPALFLPPPRPLVGEAWVDVLDVGQGLAVLVRTAGHALLYDTGPQYSPETNAGQRVVVPYLRAVGVRHLDALVVSHRDKDHAGGFAAVREHAAIGRHLSSLSDPGGELCAAGQGWEWDGVRFSILHPEADAYAQGSKKANSLSCVLRIENGSRSVLLTADIEAADENALIRRAADALRSDVLVVPHHGGMGSSTAEFINAVAPREAVFSAGYRNAFRHPRPEVLARYAASGIWRTDRDGAARIMLGETVDISAWRQERRRYWQHR